MICRYVIRRVWVVFMVLPYLVSAQDLQINAYRISYKAYVTQKGISAFGKLVTHVDSVYLQSEAGPIDSIVIALASSKRGLLSDVRFGEDDDSHKLFVNPILIHDPKVSEFVNREQIYYYTLENRQSIRIRFTSFSVKAITVPLKIRFGNDDLDFSTEVNLGLFGGFSWGNETFTRRSQIGNTEIERKNSLGILLGTERLVFEFTDDENEEIEEETGVISVGIGFVHSYQGFTVGLTGGFDFALGENNTKWEYHQRPWIGLAIGFSFLSF